MDNDTLVQLATRIPKQLHKEVKIFCAANNLSMLAFVADALQAKLDGESSKKAKPQARAAAAVVEK